MESLHLGTVCYMEEEMPIPYHHLYFTGKDSFDGTLTPSYFYNFRLYNLSPLGSHWGSNIPVEAELS